MPAPSSRGDKAHRYAKPGNFKVAVSSSNQDSNPEIKEPKGCSPATNTLRGCRLGRRRRRRDSENGGPLTPTAVEHPVVEV